MPQSRKPLVRAWPAASAILLAGSAALRGHDCGPVSHGGDPVLRVVIVLAGEADPSVARRIADLGANTIATTTPPSLPTARVAEAAGLGYLPRMAMREIDRLPTDAARVEEIRSMPAIIGFQYLDDSVLEGYASPATQARAYGILKALFPDRLAIYATRLDPVASDSGYLAKYYRPEFTDLVTPYFYPVGTTVHGPQQASERWEDRLRSLLEPLAAVTPGEKPMLPVLQGFEQIGYPVGGGLLPRQLRVYADLWPENRNLAVFWWGGPLDEPLVGLSQVPILSRGLAKVFGAAPARPAPCVPPAHRRLESPP
jgi:hypothetical protein